MGLFSIFRTNNDSAVERSESNTTYNDPVSNTGFTYNNIRDDKLSVVYGCIRIRSNTVAQLPLKIYRKLDRGREEAKDNPNWNLLTRRPNQFQTPFQLWQWVVRQLDIHGNAYLKRIRNGMGQTIELWPLNADSVTVKINPEDGKPYYTVSFKGTTDTYDSNQIIHFKGYSIDGVVGLSTIETFRVLFDGYSILEDAGTQIAKNTAKTPNLITHPSNVRDEELKKLKEGWASGFSGDNAGKTGWLPNTYDIKSVPNGLSASDAQYIEQKRFAAQRIAADIFGIPQHQLGLSTAPTYASVEQMAIEFVSYTITPILVNLEQTLNEAFFGEQEDIYVKFNVKSLLRGDDNTRRQMYQFYLTNGCMTPNQVNELEDNGIVVPAEQGGDTYVRQLNIAPATSTTPNSGSLDK